MIYNNYYKKMLKFIILSLLLISCSAFIYKSRYQTKNYNNYHQLNMIENKNIAKVTSMFIALTLPTMINTIALPQIAYADKAYKSLDQPTAEFLEEVKNAAAKKEADLKVRKEWDIIIEKLIKSGTAEGKENALKDLTSLLRKYNNGIPTGVKKIEVVKLCRSLKYDDPLSKRKKTLPTWTTPVEIAYEAFIQEFNKQITPKSASDNKF